MTKTRQEIFDIAYRGLASQGFERSIAVSGAEKKDMPLCSYRGVHGRKCAIGWCIPDDHYSEALEGDLRHAVFKAADIDGDDFDFCELLRCAHDESRTPDEMKLSLAEFASEFQLSIPEVTP